MSDADEITKAVEKRLKALLEGVSKSRDEDPKAVLRLSQSEIDTILALNRRFTEAMTGKTDGTEGLLTRVTRAETLVKAHDKVLYGPSPEKATEGIVSKVAENTAGRLVGTRVMWLIGAAATVGLVRIFFELIALASK